MRTVPLSWAPLQLARDGEDYAFHFLSGCATSPLEVYSDCAGSITCAVGVGKALAKGAARRHLWHRWWQELGGLEEWRLGSCRAYRVLQTLQLCASLEMPRLQLVVRSRDAGLFALFFERAFLPCRAAHDGDGAPWRAQRGVGGGAGHGEGRLQVQG